MLGIVISGADSASLTIKDALLDEAGWAETIDDAIPVERGGGTVYRQEGVEMREFEDWHLNLERPADAFGELSLLVFASRHSGETGPLLTAHHTGNFGPAEFGGKPNDLARACPNAHSQVLEELSTFAPAGYEVGIECTHHGPTDVGAPSMFVEIGSDKTQWNDSEAATAVARAILSLRGFDPNKCEPQSDSEKDDGHNCRHLVGIGGGHYAQRFKRIIQETDWAVGHIAADWGLDAIDAVETERDVLKNAFEQSNAEYAVIDGENAAFRSTIENRGYRVVSETWVRETDGVGLDLIAELESAIGAIDEGLRIGDQALTMDEPEWIRLRLPEKLLTETVGIDRDQVRKVVEAESVAFMSAEGGTIPAGLVVLSDMDHYDSIIDQLVSVLQSTYDEVERGEVSVTVRTETFDPEKAATLGVPEGPAFGKLASGQPVEVRGEPIPPSAVRSVDEQTFSVTPSEVM